MEDDTYRVLSNAADRRTAIRARTAEGLKALFPIIGKRTTLELTDVKVREKNYSSNEQKAAIMTGRTLHEPITGTLTLKDQDGKVLETQKKHTLAHLPYFTERHTFIMGGNEYDIPSQLRLKPGVYTRERNNGEFEAAFNLSKGKNFRLSMEPDTGRLHMELGTSKIPLYALLRAIGVPEADIRSHWGKELRDVNAARYATKEEVVTNKVLDKIKRAGDVLPTTLEGKQDFIRSYFEATEMDPEVNQRTLGSPLSSAGPLALLKASEKLIKVQRGEADEDDRDSLEFKTLHSVDDFFYERLALNAKRTTARKLAIKLNYGKGKTIKQIVPSSTFTRSINSFITGSNLSSIPMQINPMEIVDHAYRVTSLGEGGISSDRAVPFASRQVHNTHLGILDPVRTPETFKAGVDIRVGTSAYRDKRGNLYALMREIRSGKIKKVSAMALAKSTVLFPGQDGKTQVDAIRGADIVSVKRSEADYEVPDATRLFSPTTAMIPFLNGMQGNRAIMGSKFQTQALPLPAREAPYVQAGTPVKGRSMEQEMAFQSAPTAPVDGTVTKVDADFIYLRPDGPKTAAPSLIKIPYDTYFPLAAKTYLHNDVRVKAGDKVKKHQVLASSNFTKNDTMALGKNLSVGYMAYYGKNSNDAVVISAGAADKLTSEHMYKEMLSKGPDVILGKKKYVSYYGMVFTAAQLAKLDSDGVIKPGETVVLGDPLILGLRKAPPSPESALLGNFHKSLVRPYRDIAVVWQKNVPAKVQDVVPSVRQIMVTLRTLERMKIGDKVSNRYGGKGVVSEIIPDEQMVQNEAGDPIDVLFTSASVVSRINPAQIVEAALGKVVAKTGKPIIVPSFMPGDNVQYAKKLLKKHGLKDKETVYDPISGKKIKNIFVGNSYIHKLFKSTETNYSARGVSTYDINHQPIRGGADGAKGVGRMEINALLAHDARNILQEMLTVKSDKSDEFWRSYEFGLPAPPPKNPFAAEKFTAMLQGAGISIDKKGSDLTLGPLTDRDIVKMSSGALAIPSLEKSRSFMVNAKDMKPERGGLFDPARTGGMEGTRWSHLELAEPVVNPVFEDPVRRLLGVTQAELRTRLGSSGGAALRKELNRIDINEKQRELVKATRTLKGASLDNAIKQLKYLRALERAGHTKVGDAYILTKVPVIPPVMRPILPSQRGNELQVSDVNYLYRDVGLASEALRSIASTGLPQATADARQHLNDTTRALFGTAPPTSPQLQGRDVKGFIEQLTGKGSPKTSFLHKKLLSRRLDLTGRGTATPDVTLNLDQVGVPADMLWVTYSKFIMKGLIGQGYAPALATEMLEERHHAAKAVLDQELKRRPMLVNRAPSLHKHNMVAAYPVITPGKSLRINPFMEQGQNLDYDGDAMQLHVPVGDKALEEARAMTLSSLLFSDKNRDDLMVFPQHEAILGVYQATASKESGPAKRFKTEAGAREAYRQGKITMNTPVKIG